MDSIELPAGTTNPKEITEKDEEQTFRTKSLFLLEGDLSDKEFEMRTKLSLVSAVFFMIAGPLFAYYGFYLLTSPYTVKWGALSIALGLLLLMFAFSQWQDRQMMVLSRQIRQENIEIKRLIAILAEQGGQDRDP
jgi:small neutral amino acid transporter SnatA (MarC family)